VNQLTGTGLRAATSAKKGAGKAFYLSFLARINPTTTQALLGATSQQMMKGFDEMHLLLSTGGGEVQAGLAAYNVLRALPLKIVTYNVGSVNSIGNVLFLAGDERYAAKTSSFMFHGVGFDVEKTRFEEKDLNEKLDNVRNDQRLIADIISRHTNVTGPAVEKLFLSAAFIPAKDAVQHGLIDEVIDVQVPKGAAFLQLAFQTL
jgi:ATP-dependent Clp protease, protease subunit